MVNQIKHILSLDVSTSCVGVSIFEDKGTYGQLVHLEHVELKGTIKNMREKWEKRNMLKTYLEENIIGDYNIVKIIIEEPLIQSKIIQVATNLNKFCGILYPLFVELFDIHPVYISVNESRRLSLPELIGGKKGTTFLGDFPMKIAGKGRSYWSKFLIMFIIGRRFKEIGWMLSNNLTVCKKNFDRADSVVVGVAQMVKEGFWNLNDCFDAWGFDIKSTDLKTCVEVIEKNLAYEIFCNQIVKKDKTLKPHEKKIAKQNYLTEHFDIKKYINTID